MTVVFDQMARKRYLAKMNHSELEYDENIPVSKMTMKSISTKVAREYISTFHYSQSTPDSSRFIYAGFLGEKLAGIVVFAMGANDAQYKALIPDIKEGEYVELARLWSPDSMPKNTESRLIGMALKMLPLEIKLVMSFSDEKQNHIGTIYQATNWYYCGMTGGGNMMIDKDGNSRHVKSINIYRLRHPELRDKTSEEIMEIYGWKYVEGGKKHRYCFIRGNKKERKKMFKCIEDKILPYPKSDKKGFYKPDLNREQTVEKTKFWDVTEW